MRPTAVRLQSDETSATDETGATGATGADSAFRGRGYDHALTVTGGTTLVRVLSEHRWNRTDSPQISVEPDGCLLFPGATITRPEPTRTDPIGATTRPEPAPFTTPFGLAAPVEAPASGPRTEAIRS